MSASTPATPSSMIDRVVEILDAFAVINADPAGLTLSQVVARTGLPRSTAHRILEHLVKVRWLGRDEHRYHLGMRMIELGGLAVHQHALRPPAVPHLHELQHATGLVVHLAVLDGGEIVYLGKLGGRFGARVPSRVGGRQPASCTSVGKALLAFADDDTAETVLAGPLPRRTSASITDPGRLRAELSRVRHRGVAFDREEAVPGIGCVAAPVRGPGNAVAAISVCGPIGRINLERFVHPVQEAAARVWRAAASSGRPADQPRAAAAPARRPKNVPSPSDVPLM